LVEKLYYSAFRKTNLEKLLRDRGITKILLCGVATHYCVKATAIDGFHLGFDVVLVDDCTGASTEEKHKAAIEEMAKNFAQISNSREIVENI
jgi:nicotinamidase/pyrazinamidase